MKLEYVKVASYKKKSNVCPHNNACECMVKNCHRCGWNPIVAQMRLDKLNGKGK